MVGIKISALNINEVEKLIPLIPKFKKELDDLKKEIEKAYDKQFENSKRRLNQKDKKIYKKGLIQEANRIYQEKSRVRVERFKSDVIGILEEL